MSGWASPCHYNIRVLTTINYFEKDTNLQPHLNQNINMVQTYASSSLSHRKNRRVINHELAQVGTPPWQEGGRKDWVSRFVTHCLQMTFPCPLTSLAL